MTTGDKLNRSADEQRRLAAAPAGNEGVAVDHDSATPTPADTAR